MDHGIKGVVIVEPQGGSLTASMDVAIPRYLSWIYIIVPVVLGYISPSVFPIRSLSANSCGLPPLILVYSRLKVFFKPVMIMRFRLNHYFLILPCYLKRLVIIIGLYFSPYEPQS